jgi:hypothetical protein
MYHEILGTHTCTNAGLQVSSTHMACTAPDAPGEGEKKRDGVVSNGYPISTGMDKIVVSSFDEMMMVCKNACDELHM